MYRIHSHITSLVGSIGVQSAPNEGTTLTLHFRN